MPLPSQKVIIDEEDIQIDLSKEDFETFVKDAISQDLWDDGQLDLYESITITKDHNPKAPNFALRIIIWLLSMAAFAIFVYGLFDLLKRIMKF